MISKAQALFWILAMSFLGSAAAGAFPPYYDVTQIDEAKVAARQRTLPLAWMGISPHELDGSTNGSFGHISQALLPILSDRTVVILFEGPQSNRVPPDIYAQFALMDDGVLPNGHHWNSPKVVFTNPEGTKILGRISNTQMQRDGIDVAVSSALQIIRNDDAALARTPLSTVESFAPTVIAPPRDKTNVLDSVWNWVVFVVQNSLYFALAGAFLLCLMVVMAWRFRRNTEDE